MSGLPINYRNLVVSVGRCGVRRSKTFDNDARARMLFSVRVCVCVCVQPEKFIDCNSGATGRGEGGGAKKKKNRNQKPLTIAEIPRNSPCDVCRKQE